MAQCSGCNASAECLQIGCSQDLAKHNITPCCQYCCPEAFTEQHYADHPEDYVRQLRHHFDHSRASRSFTPSATPHTLCDMLYYFMLRAHSEGMLMYLQPDVTVHPMHAFRPPTRQHSSCSTARSMKTPTAAPPATVSSAEPSPHPIANNPRPLITPLRRIPWSVSRKTRDGRILSFRRVDPECTSHCPCTSG